MDEYLMDSHKLMYHPKLVSDWLDGKQVYPIFVEISLTSACNHRCQFCAPRFFLNYKPIYIDTKVIKETIHNMASVGVKSVMFAGEGESLLHKDAIHIIKYAKECGLDVCINTNGVLFDARLCSELLPILSWIRFSVDAGDLETYRYLHNAKPMDFKTVLDNISRASFRKRLKKMDVDIGVQSILFDKNIESLPNLAKLLTYLKPDYFVVKPYSEHACSTNKDLHPPTKEQIDVFLNKMRDCKKYYDFIYREIAINSVGKKKIYDKCNGKDFIAYIDATGGVYSCLNYLGNESFCYGNIYKDSFENIWKNKKDIKPNLDECRTVCRIDNINKYLYELKNDCVKHKNFI